MHANNHNHRTILINIANQAMLEQGLLPEFSSAALAELGQIQGSGAFDGNTILDKRNLLWASIDNDDSRDLDQLTTAEAIPGGNVNILVAIADVDSSVKKGSAIDEHARHNTTTVYTPARIFPMLPEKLSTDLTSLNFDAERLSIVVEMEIDSDGAIKESIIYTARVRNRAKLAYNSVAAWLEKKGEIPEEIAAVQGLAENLQMQNQAARRMKNLRHLHGALSLETIEAKPVFDGDQIRSLEVDEPNRAKEIIEDFMIGANGVTARYLSASGFPSIRRVVRIPKRWERIVEIAADYGFKLPTNPDSKALEEFLIQQKAADPLRFPDLSLAVIKLLGAGEYIAELPEGNIPGHFGLAVKDYAHSTAPNRRFPDLLTQRLLKAALEGKPVPYRKDELDILATHCTEAEDSAKKVERQVEKSAAALLLEARIGEKFDSIVTGASEKGTWVRLLSIPVEGKLVQGFDGVDVGNRLRVQLIDTNVERGFIDFKKVGSGKY
ncbi:MAG: ribonuclease II [Chloroflexi bacterium GWB2_49_20]|nr:MAG: ribonuclease II [Chloroflexi bacterium GWB2_49_20]OGN77461.1 MAG: ribonuclease II [Chloroflexi bacterium GWC2_49_37]OGN84835.1 MAG: ribonuclease II [Chloroflexi bacterium GWD2_49_16]HCC79242.1 ribonuclease II [Anaerolineae bacterium]